jgi:hypothetical protein
MHLKSNQSLNSDLFNPIAGLVWTSHLRGILSLGDNVKRVDGGREDVGWDISLMPRLMGMWQVVVGLVWLGRGVMPWAFLCFFLIGRWG